MRWIMTAIGTFIGSVIAWSIKLIFFGNCVGVPEFLLNWAFSIAVCKFLFLVFDFIFERSKRQ